MGSGLAGAFGLLSGSGRGAGAPRRHFLHIPKTGGTAVSAALAPHAAAHGLVLHPHATRLADIPEGEGVFFTLREPIARFVSGFNSRMRQGRPRYDRPWSADEAVAFARFATPDALGRGLSDPDPAVRGAAALALRRIDLVSVPLGWWLFDRRMLSRRRGDILGMLRQENLAADFAVLCAGLGLPAGISLPEDPVAAHRAPAGSSTALGDEARANLERWYATDIALHAWCLRFLSTSGGNAATPRA